MSGDHALHAELEELLGRPADELPEGVIGKAGLEIAGQGLRIWVLSGILCMAQGLPSPSMRDSPVAHRKGYPTPLRSSTK